MYIYSYIHTCIFYVTNNKYQSIITATYVNSKYIDNGFGGDQQQLRGQQPTMPASAPGYRQKQSPLNSMVYNSNKSLQEWLENCSRDRSSFMSSEFLEANGRDLPTMMQPPSTYRSNLVNPINITIS